MPKPHLVFLYKLYSYPAFNSLLFPLNTNDYYLNVSL